MGLQGLASSRMRVLQVYSFRHSRFRKGLLFLLGCTLAIVCLLAHVCAFGARFQWLRVAAMSDLIAVEVRLINGKAEKVSVDLNEDVAALLRRAQAVLEVGSGRLLDSSGRVLDPCEQINRARVNDGDSLTLLITCAQICGMYHAFAVIEGDGSVATRGNGCGGVDNTAVQDQLKNVKQIRASHNAFAALLVNGNVVAWGYENARLGSAVQQQLNVRRSSPPSARLLPFSVMDLS